jgi:hypothetical protein
MIDMGMLHQLIASKSFRSSIRIKAVGRALDWQLSCLNEIIKFELAELKHDQ